MGKNKTSTSSQLKRATYASITQGALVLWPAKTHGNLGARHHVPTREEDFANRRPAGLHTCAPLVSCIIQQPYTWLFFIFRNSFLYKITVSFTMVIKRSPGGQACRWRAVNFEIHLWSSGKNADSPPYKSEKLSKSCTFVATSAEQAELFRVVREGHPIPESTCWTSPIVIQPVEKRPFWSNGKKHVFLWKLAPAQEKDWAKGYPKVSPFLPFSLPVIRHLCQHAFLAFGEEFPGWNLKSS